MVQDSLLENPFSVTTPEDMSARDVVDLFVDVFSDFPKVIRQGHVFLNGPRGSGKSMMFRYMLPDCQILAGGSGMPDLPFLGVYVPLKKTNLKLTELERLRGQGAEDVLNEHFMTTYATSCLFDSLEKLEYRDAGSSGIREAREFASGVLVSHLQQCGWKGQLNLEQTEGPAGVFGALHALFIGLFKEVLDYLRRLSFSESLLVYQGPLCGYLDFFCPVVEKLRGLPFLPDGPVFLLVDDADNLSLSQTEVLNSWVASRTSANVSIKISTQFQYKTYRTPTGRTIDSPHDYSEINISTKYTTSHKGTYYERVKAIVEKRLSLVDAHVSPEDFFPVDVEQEEQIEAIAAKYRAEWSKSGRGHRPSDDATRYARPDYMKSLAGTRKAGSTYSYAGFSQLVHVSSGVIRHFLEAAAVMYSEVQARVGPEQGILAIPPGIQNDIVCRQANEFLFDQFEKLREDQSGEAADPDLVEQLHNLVHALGGTFRHILLSDRSERRVFSIAFSNTPTEEMRRVLRLGEQLGYFHVSTIGNKEGTGRTELYILSRKLAPVFKLDPTSFAGYLFVTADRIAAALRDPKAFVRKVQRDGADEALEPLQLNLIDDF